MDDLFHKHCIPCKKGDAPLKKEVVQEFFKQLADGWKVVAGHHLEKSYAFKNFKDALAFTSRVGELAEQEGHHPDIHLSWAKVNILIWTHKIDGLTESDFILAVKIDVLYIGGASKTLEISN